MFLNNCFDRKSSLAHYNLYFFVCFSVLIGGIKAQQACTVEPCWPTVGVAWAISVVTIVIAYLIFRLFMKCRRSRIRASATSGNFRDNLIDGGRNKDVDVSLNPLMKNTALSSGAQNTPKISKENSPHLKNSRRHQDEVSQWCNDKRLPEALVRILRSRNFQTRDQLDALRPDDLQELTIPDLPCRVQLRTVLEKQQSLDQPRMLPGSPISTDSGSCDQRLLSSTSSDNSTVISIPPKKSPSKRSNTERLLEVDNEKGFRGLLSNKGLWKLTNMIGSEWRHLAGLLKISKRKQDMLLEDHPRHTEHAVYDMLVYWRDETEGSKEQLKDQLYTALLGVGRTDIANKLMEEKVHGSGGGLNERTKTMV